MQGGPTVLRQQTWVTGRHDDEGGPHSAGVPGDLVEECAGSLPGPPTSTGSTRESRRRLAAGAMSGELLECTASSRMEGAAAAQGAGRVSGTGAAGAWALGKKPSGGQRFARFEWVFRAARATRASAPAQGQWLDAKS